MNLITRFAQRFDSRRAQVGHDHLPQRNKRVSPFLVKHTDTGHCVDFIGFRDIRVYPKRPTCSYIIKHPYGVLSEDTFFREKR